MRRRPAEYRYDASNSGISTTITKMVFCRNLTLPSKLTMTIVNFSIVVANKRDDPQVLTTSINEYQRTIATTSMMIKVAQDVRINNMYLTTIMRRTIVIAVKLVL